MLKQVIYGNQATIEAPASGVSGVLCRSIDSTYFFRIYNKDKTFTDYDLRHDDLKITIAADALASFYQLANDERVLDHSSAVLGLSQVDKP
jgi:hypothetical protein